MPKNVILNSKGEAVKLNAREQHRAEYLANEFRNATGYEVDITTLTAVTKRVVEQKFFEIAPADFLPVRVGEHSWSAEILTYRDFSSADDFSTGVVNTASADTRIAGVDSALDSVTVKVKNWAKSISWSMFDLQLASQSGNWDIVSSKERARKKNWDLGIQKVAFLGLAGDASVNGLFNMTGVNANTAVITKYIKSMNASEFETFIQTIIGTYRANNNFTSMPTHFIMPELDYTGLGVATSEDFALKTKLERLTDVFRTITQNPNFQIKSNAYADEVNNTGILDKNRYTLLNYDEDSVRMDIPVDYSNTAQNTINGMQFQNVGYGQFTGANAYRPLETLYFDFTN